MLVLILMLLTKWRNKHVVQNKGKGIGIIFVGRGLYPRPYSADKEGHHNNTRSTRKFDISYDH